MKRFAVALLVTLVVMAALDFVWLTTAMAGLYRPMMGDLLKPAPDMAAAAAFYLLYGVGVTALITVPVMAGSGQYGELAWKAGLFGLVAYATYDLTGLSVIRGWSLPLSLIDMAWGVVITALSALTAGLAVRAIGQSRSQAQRNL